MIRNFRGLLSWGGETGKLKADLVPIEDEMRGLLDGAKARAPTYEFARELLKVWPASCTFVEVEGVESTSNAAERALRPAVIWRKVSFGTWSDWGSRFVERLSTVVATRRSKGTDVTQVLNAAIRDWQANLGSAATAAP